MIFSPCLVCIRQNDFWECGGCPLQLSQKERCFGGSRSPYIIVKQKAPLPRETSEYEGDILSVSFHVLLNLKDRKPVHLKTREQ